MKLGIPFLISVVVLLVLDLLWLGVIMGGFYDEGIGHLRREGFGLIPALIFYVLYTGGVYLFAVLPAIRSQKMQRALTLGVLLGFLTYGTYNLTNLAVLQDWPVLLTVVDMLWGAFLTGVLSVVGFLLVRMYNKKKVESPIAV